MSSTKLAVVLSVLSLQSNVLAFNPFIKDADDFFGDFIDQEIEMLNRMKQERQRMQKQFSQTVPFSQVKIEIKDQEKENKVDVIIKGITTTEFNAQLNDDEDVLTIKTPNELIKVHAQDKVLAVEVQQQMRQEQKPAKASKQDIEEDNEEVKPVHVISSFVASSVVRSAQRITDELDLEQQTIDYDKASQTLTISIPKAKAKKKGKPVPVNIK